MGTCLFQTSELWAKNDTQHTMNCIDVNVILPGETMTNEVGWGVLKRKEAQKKLKSMHSFVFFGGSFGFLPRRVGQHYRQQGLLALWRLHQRRAQCQGPCELRHDLRECPGFQSQNGMCFLEHFVQGQTLRKFWFGRGIHSRFARFAFAKYFIKCFFWAESC